MIQRYDNLDHFLQDAESAKMYGESGSYDWAGDAYPQALEFARYGNDSLVHEAEALLDQLEHVDEGDNIKSWSPSPMGAYAVVPEYLAGQPFCMRSYEDTEERSPVNIYVCSTISAMLESEHLRARGVAILALVLRLQCIRPVCLNILSETHGKTDGDYLMVIPIQSQPLSIAHACYALTSNAFPRQLCYSVARQNDGFNGRWGRHYRNNGMGGPKYIAWLRDVLEMQPQDLYIKAGHYLDKLITEPIAWIHEQLEKYKAGEFSEMTVDESILDEDSEEW